MGNADALALILACTTATDTLVNFRGCVLQRPCKLPIAPMGKMLTHLLTHLILACTTANDASVNYRGCVLKRP